MSGLPIMFSADQWQEISGVATIGSLLVALYQLLAYLAERKRFAEFRATTNRRIWGDIQLLLEVYDSIDDARASALDASKLPSGMTAEAYLASKLSSARRGVVAAYLRLLEQAINDEDRFTEETAKEWRRLGKLENDWRYAKALKFVSTREPQNSRRKPLFRSAS